MTITSRTVEPGIVAVTVDYPPVNAIPSRGWFELADVITAAGRDMATHVVILRAEGRGFNAGVDIKEMQNTEGFTALIDANRGCFAAFRAVYECEVPVVAAVNGFCVGGGIGLVGNADVIVASDDATFGLPDDARAAEILDHAEACDVCAEHVTELESVVELAQFAYPDPMPAAVEQQLMAALAREAVGRTHHSLPSGDAPELAVTPTELADLSD